jgi:general stress protein YciG
MEKVIKEYLREIGARGGKATARRHGRKQLAAWGAKGGRATAAKRIPVR